MSERVAQYFDSLSHRASKDLDREAREIVVREKHEAARLIAHIAEIGARGYHKELGYSSMFDYCVRRLHLTEGSVFRRTQVAKVCRRFPQILDALATGKLHITSASLIAPHLEDDNVEELLKTVEYKTAKEVEKITAALAPKETFSPSVRKLTSRTGDRGVPDLTVPEEQPERTPSTRQGPRDICEPAT